MGPASIKMYDKFGLILRIETTTNDVSFFKHHRAVEQRDGQKVFKLANLKKGIYSLQPDLAELMADSNKRYLAFVSELDDFTPGEKALDKISRAVEENGRSYKGFNFFSAEELERLLILLRGEFCISGFRNTHIRRYLPELTSSQVSYFFKRLRLHGMVKKVGKSYKYYITEFGRRVLFSGLKIRELFLIPSLAN